MNKKVLISVVVLIIIIWVIYYFTNKAKKDPNFRIKTKGTIYPLYIGYKGEIVKDIQSKLNRIDRSWQLEVDGIIGTKTMQALKTVGYYPLTQEGYFAITEMAA